VSVGKFEQGLVYADLVSAKLLLVGTRWARRTRPRWCRGVGWILVALGALA